jgi:hypothetical protein
MSQKLQDALRVLVSAMRDDEQHEPGDEAEREVASSDVPRPMGYFSQKPAKTETQRAANVADPDAPLVMRAVLLAPPDKQRKVAA